ncbi:MAG: hypothetical protein IKO85_08400 [Bacteroidaceae bacterium]|nr:hypothetical protein [Bacteroidaceae bacterium]
MRGRIQRQQHRIRHDGQGHRPSPPPPILQHRKQGAGNGGEQAQVVNHRNHSTKHRVDVAGKGIEEEPPYVAQEGGGKERCCPAAQRRRRRDVGRKGIAPP